MTDDPGSQKLAVATTAHGDDTTMAVTGELDVLTGPLLRQAVEEVAASRPRIIVIDVEQVSFLDSYGVACLLGVRKLLASREIRLTVRCGTDTPAARVLAISGLNRVLDLR